MSMCFWGLERRPFEERRSGATLVSTVRKEGNS